MFYITITTATYPQPQFFSFTYQKDAEEFIEAAEQINDVETIVFTDSKGKLIETYTNLHLEN